MLNLENSSKKEINSIKKLKNRVTFNTSAEKIREAQRFLWKFRQFLAVPLVLS